MTQQEAISEATSVLTKLIREGGLGLFSTVDERGFPHATWMSTLATTGNREILTLTSPDSRKISNITSNPNVEWLFSSPEFDDLVYLTGVADVITEPSILKAYWNLIEDKDRAFFLRYCTPGIGFAAIRTQITGIKLVKPKERASFEIGVIEFWSNLESVRKRIPHA